jgi:hypothetical protein
MKKYSKHWVLCPPLLILVILTAHGLGYRRIGVDASPLPLDDWDIPDLVTYLNRTGIELRVVASHKTGLIRQSAYLTTTDKDWLQLNHLAKDARGIRQWDGILYCERVGNYDPTALVQQWGDNCLYAEPFLFYGDTVLLSRVRDALSLPAPPAALQPELPPANGDTATA